MAKMIDNHARYYIERAIRTQKKEYVKSLITASYYAEKNATDDKNIKSIVIDRLKNSLALYRDNVRGYDNGVGGYNESQFDKEYTIGHEMAIWKNSNLELTDYAKKVAEDEITIVDYFDRIFLNFFQPVNNQGVHPLSRILKYLIKNNTNNLNSKEVPIALEVLIEDQDIPGLLHFMGDTSYFKEVSGGIEYISKISKEDLLELCDVKYEGAEGYQLAKVELSNSESYCEYISKIKNVAHQEKKLNINDQEKNILDEFKIYYNQHINDYKNDEEALENIRLREKFVSEYPISRWIDMSLDEYVLGTDNFTNSLSYKLEFGEYKHTGMGIGGGASSKHGIYYSKDLCYRGYKNEVIENPEEYWNEFKKQMYNFFKEIESTRVFPIIDERYSMIRTIPLVAVKLCFLYFPELFISIGSRDKLQSIINLFVIESNNDNISSKMSFDICEYFKHNFSERLNDDSQWLGYCLWRFISERQSKEEEVEMNIENENIEYDKYSKEDFLNEVFIDESKYDSIISILNKKKNIILEGAPGVGKTFMAKRLAYSILGEKDSSKVKLIQFHQSYSYEDFIEGYRPTENGFELEKGIFYKLCKKAQNDVNSNYYIIIDEINRGNLSKIFGELLMLIESDKRGEKLSLAYSEEEFTVPANLYIIGLMNTADRSLALIDYALRRRFSFIRIEPAFDNPKFIENFNSKFDDEYKNVLDIISKINEAIENDKSLGSGFKIGHSYFCPNIKDRKGNKKDIEDILIYEILPLLEEYWYDDEDSLIQWKSAIDGVIND